MNDWNPYTPVKLLWMRRDLLWQFTKRNIQTGFRGSYLGVFWVVLGPLMMLGLYSFVFGVVFGGGFESIQNGGERVRLEGVDYALGIFLGLSVLNLVSGALASCSTLIVSNPNFVKKVVFPLESELPSPPETKAAEPPQASVWLSRRIPEPCRVSAPLSTFDAPLLPISALR